MTLKDYTRTSIAFYHLVISLIIFGILFGMLIAFWYRPPYFYVAGGWSGLKIAALVSLVLGPLLTFVLFNRVKTDKELFSDLSVVVLIQLSALFWGVYMVFQQRPVANVFWQGSFLAVTADDLERYRSDLTFLQKFGDSKPVLIYLKDPEDKHKYFYSQELDKTIAISPFYRTDLYLPLHEHFQEMNKYQLNMEYWATTNDEVNTDLRAYLEKNNKKIADYQYYKLYSKYKSIIFIFSEEGNIVNYITAPLDFAS